MTTFSLTTLVPGAASGRPLILDEPLSFWGGLDPQTGEIIDRRHPQSGQTVTGRVMFMTSGRGSSSGSSILLEAIRAGSAPAAIVLAEADGIVALGAVVAQEIYGRPLPICQLSADDYATALNLLAEKTNPRIHIDQTTLKIA